MTKQIILYFIVLFLLFITQHSQATVNIPVCDSAWTNQLQTPRCSPSPYSAITYTQAEIDAIISGLSNPGSESSPTLQEIFTMPLAEDLGQIWFIGFSLPIFLWLVSWAFGSLINFFKPSHED